VQLQQLAVCEKHSNFFSFLFCLFFTQVVWKAVLWIHIGFNADPDPAFLVNADPDSVF
jgi:hypothetical protein